MSILGLALQAAVAVPVPGLPGTTLPVAVPVACRVVDVAPTKAVKGGAGLLMAVCGSRGAPLGVASQYSAVSNVVTGGVLVVRKRGGQTDVLMVSPTSGGVAVDDVTRDLARLTGRFGDLGLGPFAVDASRFAVDGSVGVVAAGSTRWLDLKSYVLRAAKLVTTALPSTAVPTPAARTGN